MSIMNRPGTLDPELQIEIFLTDVRREYLPNDIFDSLSSEFINPTGEDAPAIPNAIYMKLSAEADKGRSCKVPLIKDLCQAPTIGTNGDQVGNEEDYVTKHFSMQYTDLSHATVNQAYGLLARDKQPYQLFDYRAELLGRYFKQYFGKMRRQTLLERQSENLEDAPHFAAAGFSPNWFIPNREFHEQPVFTRNTHDWTDRIVATMHAAGTGIQCAASPMLLLQLSEYARDVKNIIPIEFEDGTDGYVVTMPTPQATWFKNLVQKGSGGWIWTQVAQMGADILKKYPMAIGKFNDLLIVEDQRYPTLSLGGSASYGNAAYNYTSDSGIDYTLTAQYRAMGNADDGSSDPRDKSATARQVMFLCGKAAICEWMPEGFHWKYNYQDYDKFFGTGVFCSVGMKQPIYDNSDGVDDDDDSTVQQMGSIVIPLCQPSRTYYYEGAT